MTTFFKGEYDADGIQALLAAAEEHGGEGEPDMEVGDLQMVAASCWKRLTPEQRREVVLEQEEWLARNDE